MTMEKRGARKKRLLYMLLLSVIMPASGLIPAEAAGPGFVPLTRDNMALLLQRTVQAKLIPVTVKDESGFSVTITGLKDFAMNWETNELTADLTFQAEYVNPWFPIPVTQNGEAIVSGRGRYSAGEQKIGVEMVSIDEMTFQGLLQIAHEPIRKLLNRKLTGKAFWQGGAPAQSEVLTGTNWTEMLRIAVAQQLPHSGSNDKTSYTITGINALETSETPGCFAAEFALEGRHQGFFTIGFAGTAAVTASVWVDPDELRGKVRIEAVQDLNLRGIPSFLNTFILRSLDKRLKTEEFEFSWK